MDMIIILPNPEHPAIEVGYTFDVKDTKIQVTSTLYYETAEKEVQDTSCRGSGGVHQL
jgi:hypothetical protein